MNAVLSQLKLILRWIRR